jgi:hypothetical protein
LTEAPGDRCPRSSTGTTIGAFRSGSASASSFLNARIARSTRAIRRPSDVSRSPEISDPDLGELAAALRLDRQLLSQAIRRCRETDTTHFSAGIRMIEATAQHSVTRSIRRRRLACTSWSPRRHAISACSRMASCSWCSQWEFGIPEQKASTKREGALPVVADSMNPPCCISVATGGFRNRFFSTSERPVLFTQGFRHFCGLSSRTRSWAVRDRIGQRRRPIGAK